MVPHWRGLRLFHPYLVHGFSFLGLTAPHFLASDGPAQQDHAWPQQLRIDSGVYGWVILDSVPVWYEIWRQLNGFPPSLQAEPTNITPTQGPPDELEKPS